MNATVMAMLLIAVHVMICVLLCVLSRVGVLRVEGRLLPFMLLVPLWGALCVLMLHTRTLIRAGEHTAPGLEQMRVDDEERRSMMMPAGRAAMGSRTTKCAKTFTPGTLNHCPSARWFSKCAEFITPGTG